MTNKRTCPIVLSLVLGVMPASRAGDSSAKDVIDTLSKPGPFSYDIEIRTRYEVRENNFDFNDAVNSLTDDSWLLTRARIGIGWQPAPWLKIYAQGQDAREIDSDRPNVPGVLGAEGDDTFDLRQAYALIGLEKKGLSAKLGRQTLAYGDERLVGPLEWNNFSRTWDAAKLRYADDTWSVEAFTASLVRIDDDQFNRSDLFANEGLGRDQALSGVYFSTTALGFQTTDLYALHLHEAFPAGDSNVVSLGTRWKSTPGKFGPWDYTAEFVAQTGDAKGKDLAAFAGHAEIGRTFSGAWKPRVALDYSFGSGDGDDDDGKVRTFQNLYPTNHLYYGYMDVFSWQNIHDINLSVKVAPTEKTTLRLDYHAFWLADTGDAWYRANGVATVRPVTPGADSYAGSEIDLTLTYAATKKLSLMGGYSHFFAGAYLDGTGSADDADFAYVQATLKF